MRERPSVDTQEGRQEDLQQVGWGRSAEAGECLPSVARPWLAALKALELKV